MLVTREEVKVYAPDEGKAIKLSKDGKIIMYMVVPYYELPHYDYDVEEVDIEEAKNYLNNNAKRAKRIIKSFR